VSINANRASNTMEGNDGVVVTPIKARC